MALFNRRKKPVKNHSVEEKAITANEFWAEYAKAMAELTVRNPNARGGSGSSNSAKSKESIINNLKDSAKNAKALRDTSISMYNTQQRYRNLLTYYSMIPMWRYVISPLNFNKDKVKPDAFKKQYHKTCEFIDAMNIPKTMREVLLVALREGAYYGVVRGKENGSFILQTLSPDNCVIVSLTEGNVFNFAYDMSKIKDEKEVEGNFPPEFAEMYKEYEKTGEKYQTVPPEISFCVKGDPSILQYSVPPFASIMPNLYSIQDTESITEESTALSVYKLLAGKVPLDNKGVPVMGFEDSMKYYNHIANNVGEKVGVAITPFDLKSYDFEQSGSTTQIDNVARANENFFAAAGTSAMLHGATNSTSGVTKLAIKIDEAFAFGLMYQCASTINKFLKSMTGTIKFKISFLPVSIYNSEEMVNAYRSSMNYGIGKLQYAACMGISQPDLEGQSYLENEILDMNSLFVPMQTASTLSAEDKAPGRPQKEDISDEGEKTRDNGENDNK